MTVIASLITSLGLDSSSFTTGLDKARKELRATQKTFAAVGDNLTKVGAVMTVGITAPFTAMVASAIPAAVESQQAMAQVTAALTSMGAASGRTSEQLQAMAGHLQDTSNFDDDDILKSVTANLLTFGKVSGEVFDRAEQAIVDISARMGTDLQSAALMVGKALNDPVKGLTALARAGIQFTAEQKAAIAAMAASGDAAGAQAIMLGELERQFGGAAQAQRDATPTAAQDQAWRTFQENVGAVALEAMPAVTKAATTVLGAFNALPAPVQSTSIAVFAVAAAMGPTIAAIGALVSGIGAALPVLAALPALLTGSAIPAIISFGGVILPVIAPIAAVAGAVALVVAAVRHWDEIKAVADRVVGYMASLYRGVQTWIGDKLTAIWTGLRDQLRAAGDWFFHLYDRVVGHSYVPDMVDEIGQQMARLDDELVAPTRAATDAAAQAFAALQQRVAPILERLFPDQAKLNQYRRDLADLMALAKQERWSPAQIEAATGRLRNENADVVYGTAAINSDAIQAPAALRDFQAPDIVEPIRNTATAVIDSWGEAQAANDNLAKSFADMARDVTGSLRGLANDIKSGDWLGALQTTLDLVSQVMGIVRGTGVPALRTFAVGGTRSFGGGRASGGPVMPRTDYLVGERGPEILRMGAQAGRIVPNNEIGESVVTVHVQANDYFDARVVQVAGAVTADQIGSYAAGRARAARSRLPG